MAEGEPRQDALAEVVIGLLAAPIAGGLRTVDQIRRGSEELLRTIENLNNTLESLNATSERINSLLAEFEEPVRAAVPQLTRTIRTADEISQMLEGPVRTMAPALPAIADLVATTPVNDVASQAAEAMSMLREMAARLGPLAQMAENAGGLLGAFRLPGLGGSPSRSSGRNDPPKKTGSAGASTGASRKRSAAGTSDDESTARSTGKKASGTKASGKKSTGKKASGAKRAGTKAAGTKAADTKGAGTKSTPKKVGKPKRGAQRGAAERTSAGADDASA